MRRQPKPPGLAATFALVGLMHLTPRLLGVRRTVALARRLAGASSDAAVDESLIDETARRVAMAAAFYPHRALCLEQSLALCVLLRRRGAPAEFRIGVQARPFYAHTWVEIDRQPIHEHGGLPLRLATFPGLGI